MQNYTKKKQLSTHWKRVREAVSNLSFWREWKILKLEKYDDYPNLKLKRWKILVEYYSFFGVTF